METHQHASRHHTAAVDLDAFLTQLESKLRGPFTSLDFSKAVSSCLASNDKHTTSQYLSSVLSVLPRAEKVTQLRILVGILGLEPSDLDDNSLQRILTTAQAAPLYEEWVRVISGIVEDIIFKKDSESIDTNAKNEGNRLLDKTCLEIIQRVKKLEKETSFVDEETEHLLAQNDANPLFFPYRYYLLSPTHTKAIIPDLEAHSHFCINKNSEILQVDCMLEIEKIKEEQDHHVTVSLGVEPPPTKTEPNKSLQLLASKERNLSAAKKNSSSMFMPPKSHSGVARLSGGSGSQLKPVLKPQLHQRKAGAAQALLSKGRRGRMMQTGVVTGSTATSSTQGTPPRHIAGRTAITSTIPSRGVQKSKMKMIDVAEVQGLQAKKQQEVDKVSVVQKVLKSISGKKRPHEEQMRNDGIEHASKERKIGNPKSIVHVEKSNHAQDAQLMDVFGTIAALPVFEADAAGELASAALLAYQSQKASIQPAIHSPAILATEQNVSSLNMTKQQDWRDLLQLRSNLLNEDDRNRIQHFFVDRYNPTPEQRKYKMKLHEERTTDAGTGKAMKETYYLELDYERYTSMQTKKVKRYDDST